LTEGISVQKGVSGILEDQEILTGQGRNRICIQLSVIGAAKNAKYHLNQQAVSQSIVLTVLENQVLIKHQGANLQVLPTT